MERKKLRKRKGQWITVSMSALTSVLAVTALTTVASAQEVDTDNVASELSTQPEQQEDLPLSNEDQRGTEETALDQTVPEIPEETLISENVALELEKKTDVTAPVSISDSVEEVPHASEEDIETASKSEEALLIEEPSDTTALSLEEDSVKKINNSSNIPDTSIELDETEVSPVESTSEIEEAKNETPTSTTLKKIKDTNVDEINKYTGKEYTVQGNHDSQYSKFELISAVIAAEAGIYDQDGIDAVTSTVFNRADNRGTHPYTEIVRPYQYSGYSGGSVYGEPWRRYVGYDLSLIEDSVLRHSNGFRLHDYTNFYASDYFYDNGEWSGNSNAIQDDLTPYVTGKIDIGGNTFFTPAANFPWKTSADLNEEKKENAANDVQEALENKDKHRVQPKQTLYSIARVNNTTVSKLKDWNNLTSNIILPGQYLIVKQPTVVDEEVIEDAVEEVVEEDTTIENTPKEVVNEIAGNILPTYTVKRGDTLFGIANKNGLSLSELRSLNDLSGNLIIPGQNLILSSTITNNNVVEEEPATESPDPVYNTYTVNRGDTLYRIAINNDLTLAELRDLNNITSDLIVPGQVLRVSAKSSNEEQPEAQEKPSTEEKAEQKPKPKPNTATYTVKRGDTLFSIAVDNGLSLKELRELNNISGNLIVPGQSLVLSASTSNESKPQVKPQPNKPSTNTYTVKSGDTLYRIAVNNGLTLGELRELNNISGNLIIPGQSLVLSASTNNESESEVKPDPKPEENKPFEPATSSYTVKHGDTLYRIAVDNGLTLAELRELNNLSGNLIVPGQTLILTTSESNVTEPEMKPDPKPKTPSNLAPSANRYVVISGDTLFSIARANGLTVAELKNLNNLSSNIIIPGQQLMVQGSGRPSAPNRPSTPYSGNNLPDLSQVDSITTNYAVKLNGKSEPFRTSLSLAARPQNVVSYFGQRFDVTREFKTNGQTFLELTQNGRVIGYVPESAAVVVPKDKRVVYLDAGHGGSEAGAYTFGTAEKDLNLNITNQLADLLRGDGYIVYETRDVDETVALRDRHIEPNRLMPDIYVSIHHNAAGVANGGAHGIEVLYHDPVIDEPGYKTLDHHKGTHIIPEGRRLAEVLQDSLVDATGAYDRGTRAQNLWVVRNTDVPAALVELGFQDNRAEFNKLINPSYQRKLITGLVDGINAYFAGIK